MNQLHSPGPMEHNPFTGRPINGRLLLTISEAAAALRISRSSIYRLFRWWRIRVGPDRDVSTGHVC